MGPVGQQVQVPDWMMAQDPEPAVPGKSVWGVLHTLASF